jgi:colicin import membrane protein
MSDGSGKGFLFSATLHGVAAALFFFSFVMKRDDPPTKIFELVAGEGDNYMAREAPALGTPGGLKVDIPRTPETRPAPPEPVPQETYTPPPQPAPKQVTPKTVTPPKETETPKTDFNKSLTRKLIVAESKAKRDIKKEREAEAKKAAEEQKKPTTKEEYDRLNRQKSPAGSSTNKSAPPKVAKVDAEGIAKGVVGGSTSNKVGGAGGKALTTDNTDVLAGYDALFKTRLRAQFEPPPGLSDSLKVEIEVRSNADGSLSGGRVTKTSGSAEFDRAVLDALKRVRMPPRPDKKSETIEFIFTMRERSEG